jgi:hypothetical protein
MFSEIQFNIKPIGFLYECGLICMSARMYTIFKNNNILCFWNLLQSRRGWKTSLLCLIICLVARELCIFMKEVGWNPDRTVMNENSI